MTNELGDKNAVSLQTREINFYFPLWILREPDSFSVGTDASLNLSRKFLTMFTGKLHLPINNNELGLPLEISPENIICYAYSIFHSPGYRNRYTQFLKAGFPHLPLTSNINMFYALQTLGSKLVDLHLLKAPILEKPLTQFIGEGNHTIYNGYPKFADDLVLINTNQGFQGIPQDVWAFHIGGYQVCHKWLKDRRGRQLSQEDIEHYQKIIVAIQETIRLMGEIDEVIEEHGGWPIQ